MLYRVVIKVLPAFDGEFTYLNLAVSTYIGS